MMALRPRRLREFRVNRGSFVLGRHGLVQVTRKLEGAMPLAADRERRDAAVTGIAHGTDGRPELAARARSGRPMPLRKLIAFVVVNMPTSVGRAITGAPEHRRQCFASTVPRSRPGDAAQLAMCAQALAQRLPSSLATSSAPMSAGSATNSSCGGSLPLEMRPTTLRLVLSSFLARESWKAPP